MNAGEAIVIFALLAIAVWGIVVLLSNPLVQALLVLLGLGVFIALVGKGGKGS